MTHTIPAPGSLEHLDDNALLHEVRRLARRDSALLATLLAHLMLVDERRLYRGEGFGSFFDYCRGGLGWSESESWRRSQAARLCRRFPAVLFAIGEGHLHLSATCVLAPHLTEENVDELVAAAKGLTKRALQALVLERFGSDAPAQAPHLGHSMNSQPSLFDQPLPGEVGVPAADPWCARAASPSRLGGMPPVPSRLRTEAHEAAPRSLLMVSNAAPPAPLSLRTVSNATPPGVAPFVGPTRSPPLTVRSTPPLTVRTTPALLIALDKARALMAHVPGGTDTTTVLERALTLLVERLERARFGAPKRAREVARVEARPPVTPQSASTDTPVNGPGGSASQEPAIRVSARPASASLGSASQEPAIRASASPASASPASACAASARQVSAVRASAHPASPSQEPASPAPPIRASARPASACRVSACRASASAVSSSPGYASAQSAAAHPRCAPRPRATLRRGYVPARIRRAVYERDDGQCTFVAASGRRCGSTFGLQLHHRRAWALGGSDDLENLTLHCAVHNQLQAERDGLDRPHCPATGAATAERPAHRQPPTQPPSAAKH